MKFVLAQELINKTIQETTLSRQYGMPSIVFLFIFIILFVTIILLRYVQLNKNE